MTLFSYALKSLGRNRMRTVLTAASVTLPLAAVCLMSSMVKALGDDSGEKSGLFRLMTRHKVSLATPLPAAWEAKVKNLPGIVSETSFFLFGGIYKDARPQNNFIRFGVEPEAFLKVYEDFQIVSGSTADWLADRTGCLVGRNLAERMGWKVGDRVTIKGTVFPVNLDLTIRGIYYLPGGTSGALYFDRRYVDEAVPWAKGFIFWIVYRVADAKAVETVPRLVDALFENSEAPTLTETEHQFRLQFVSMLGNVKALVASIVGVLGFAVVLISANTMAMAARERTVEVAVLRTLGFGKRAIFGVLLGESALVTAIGGLVGLALFVWAHDPVRRLIISTPGGIMAGSMRVRPELLVQGFALALAVGLGSGFVPAWGAAKRPIVDGLRRVA